MIRYTLLRFLIFFGCLALLWLIGLREPNELPWLVVGAALLSMIVSAVVLRPFRADLIAQIEEKRAAKAQARDARTDTDEAVEDRAQGQRSGASDEEEETYR